MSELDKQRAVVDQASGQPEELRVVLVIVKDSASRFLGQADLSNGTVIERTFLGHAELSYNTETARYRRSLPRLLELNLGFGLMFGGRFDTEIFSFRPRRSLVRKLKVEALTRFTDTLHAIKFH